MDVQHFEQQILKLAFETNARITAASVAYYLGIPSREANRMLNQLLADGVVELDSDMDGNLFYKVPNQGEISAMFSGVPDKLEDELAGLDEPSAPPEPSRPASVLDSLSFVSATQDDGAEPFSPTSHVPAEVSAQRAADGSSAGPVVPAPPRQPSRPERRALPAASSAAVWAGADDPAPAPSPGRAVVVSNTATERFSHAIEGVQRVERSAPVRSRGVLDGVTARTMEPDAWVGNCGASPVVVVSDARCEPKPLSNARPTLVSCVDPEEEEQIRSTYLAQARQTQPQSQNWWDSPSPDNHGGAMVLAGSNGQNLPIAMSDIEQPEHQPGMALLLSLILCGTGQIYNGEVSKGIMMMVLCFLLWFVLLGWVVHIWSIVDAVVVAERINKRQHG